MTQIGDNSPVFVDTNILVYSNLANSPFYQSALARLNQFDIQGVELWVSRQVIREYLASMTRTNKLTNNISVTSLLQDIRYFSSSFQVADETALVTDHLSTLLGQVTVNGSQIYDANIVATMQAYGLRRLLTHNTADFARYASFITVLPMIP